MSFQKAHNVSNELAEVYVTTGEVQLNTWSQDQYFNTQYVSWKSYRVLEVGLIVTDSTASNQLDECFSVGVVTDGTKAGTAICPLVDLPAIAAATTPGGTVLSTSRGGSLASFDMSFSAPSTALAPTSVDSGGVPRLNAGDAIVIDYNAQTSGATKVVFFARLAPEIYRDIDI